MIIFANDLNNYRHQVLAPRPYRKAFIGTDRKHLDTWKAGNTILLQLTSDTYMYIGESVKTFKVAPGDEIVAYKSPIGNSAVPYPYAIGKKRLYLLMDTMESLDRTQVPSNEDPYLWYWDATRLVNRRDIGWAEPLSYKTLVKRQY